MAKANAKAERRFSLAGSDFSEKCVAINYSYACYKYSNYMTRTQKSTHQQQQQQKQQQKQQEQQQLLTNDLLASTEKERKRERVRGRERGEEVAHSAELAYPPRVLLVNKGGHV